MSTNEISGSFVTLRGERCNLTQIHGIDVLKTKSGIDLVEIAEGLHENLKKIAETIAELERKVHDLEEKKVEGLDAKLEEFHKRVLKCESKSVGVPGPQGPPGPAGADGEEGPSGSVGPAGAAGKRELKLQDIKDVDCAGLADGAILVYRKNKWVIEIPDYS